MRRTVLVGIVAAVLGCGVVALGEEFEPGQYRAVTQAELIQSPQQFEGAKVKIQGVFLFTGSDFCYQIRKTKINTRDYFCFALGTPSLVRLYLKKDHAQADQLLALKKGAKVTAYGAFDFLGKDYNYLVIDRFEVEPAG